MIWGPFMRKVMADWHQMCHKLSAERCQAKQSRINIQWLQIYWSLQIQILLVCESLFRTTVTCLNILTMTHTYTFGHTRNIYLSLNITNQIEKLQLLHFSIVATLDITELFVILKSWHRCFYKLSSLSLSYNSFYTFRVLLCLLY